MAGVVGLLGSREDVVKLDVTGARSQHQETLAGRKGTTGEAAIASVALVENGHGAKPAEYQVSVQASSVHTPIFWIQHPAPQTGGEVGGCLSPLFGLWAAVRGEKGERRTGGDGVGAAGVLLPQVLCDDAVKGRRRRQVALQLLFHSRSLYESAMVRLLLKCTQFFP